MAAFPHTAAEVIAALGLERYRAEGVTSAVPRSNENATRQTRDALRVYQFYAEQVGESASVDDAAYWTLWGEVVVLLQAPYRVATGAEQVHAEDADGVPALTPMIATKLPGSPYLELKENRQTELFCTSLAGFLRRMVEAAGVDRDVRLTNKRSDRICEFFPHLVASEVDSIVRSGATYADIMLTLAKNEIDMIKGTPAFDRLCETYDRLYLRKYEAYKKAMTPKPNPSWHWHPTVSQWKAEPYVEKTPKGAVAPTKKREPAKVLMRMSPATATELPSLVEVPPTSLEAPPTSLEDLSVPMDAIPLDD